MGIDKVNLYATYQLMLAPCMVQNTWTYASEYHGVEQIFGYILKLELDQLIHI
jgi:hypothetical protein